METVSDGALNFTGWPKSKPQSSIAIKSYYNPPLWLDFSSSSTTKWAKEYNKSVLNILCDLICDVINCYVWSCDTGKINASNKIMFENQKTRENMEIKELFLYKSPSKGSFRHRSLSLLRRADARGSADIIYRIWRISLVIAVTK